MPQFAGRGLSRRGVLVGALLGAGAVAMPLDAQARPSDGGSGRRWDGATSANGWPVVADAVSTPIEGSGGVTVALAAGLPQAVLGYVLRRYLYDVAGALRRGDVLGHRGTRRVAAGYESNYLSGTAVEVFPDRYPLGATDRMFPAQRRIVERILDDADGVVGWGGHLDPVKESHFQLDVGPGSGRLRAVVDKLARAGTAPARSLTGPALRLPSIR